ncbi:MAG: hypothetical protein QF724_03265 [Planctomycetota bacterium]|jgi:hypothetical protein|nr:hypothetical protein [Planctomycetota bacterium]MDP6837931.1 hypothetical protein [Planctomycetota bacterium]
MAHTADLTASHQPTGLIVNGSTWNPQAWYRDPAAQGSGFNLSDGCKITFAPVSGLCAGTGQDLWKLVHSGLVLLLHFA